MPLLAAIQVAVLEAPAPPRRLCPAAGARLRGRVRPRVPGSQHRPHARPQRGSSHLAALPPGSEGDPDGTGKRAWPRCAAAAAPAAATEQERERERASSSSRPALPHAHASRALSLAMTVFWASQPGRTAPPPLLDPEQPTLVCAQRSAGSLGPGARAAVAPARAAAAGCGIAAGRRQPVPPVQAGAAAGGGGGGCAGGGAGRRRAAGHQRRRAGEMRTQARQLPTTPAS